MFRGIFFFKQKTAYELRISDWSSDVCSSDLLQRPEIRAAILSEVPQAIDTDQALLRYIASFDYMFSLGDPPNYVPKASDSIGAKSKRLGVRPEELNYDEIGSTSCRKRVCQDE